MSRLTFFFQAKNVYYRDCHRRLTEWNKHCGMVESKEKKKALMTKKYLCSFSEIELIGTMLSRIFFEGSLMFCVYVPFFFFLYETWDKIPQSYHGKLACFYVEEIIALVWRGYLYFLDKTTILQLITDYNSSL